MRRALGTVLIALGMFAITLGVLFGSVVYDRLAKAPLDPESVTESQGNNMTVFYSKSFVDKSIPPQRTDATVRVRVIVRGKFDAPEVKVNGDTALWRVGVVVEDERRELISAMEHWVCVDRKTNEGTGPCAEKKIDDGTRVDTGFDSTGVNYKFPFDTQRKEYMYFDTTLRRAVPARFDGEDTVNGLPVYRFVQRIEPTKAGERMVPGQLVNAPEGTIVNASRYYENTRTVWVEPYTGAVVKNEEKIRQVLRGPDGREGTVVIAGTLTFTPQTVQRQVDKAKEGRDQLRLLRHTGPAIAYVLGGVLLVVGVILVLLGRRPGSAHRRGERQAGWTVPLVKSGTG
jgi:hypothetical protein